MDNAYATHEVRNQAGDLPDFDAYGTDRALRDAVAAFGAGWAEERLSHAGGVVGSRRMANLARAANRHTPELRTHDRFGNRIDEVEYHPAWHELMGLIRGARTHSLGWTEPRAGAQVARAGLSYLFGQGEPGVSCPVAMTFASLGALRHAPALLEKFRARILAPGYDARCVAPGEKAALGVGMAMTEKQGGSDLRQVQTTAARAGDGWALTGHKWFFSVPVIDLFLTLARTEKGVSCFLAQGWRDDGSRNALLIQRLKDKCGNRANASSEVEFRGLDAVLVGEEGRGIATILEMAHLTRLECALGSAALMRQASVQAIHHATRRRAFQRALVDQPIMENVLADLALESEAAMWLAMRGAAALDAAPRDAGERLLGRIAIPAAKYYVCKRAPAHVAEALEVHGGNGFVEDHMMARLYREAPLNGVWEGAGNVICLDIIRALAREPDAAAAVLAEIGRARGGHKALDATLAGLEDTLARPAALEGEARRLAETLALALAASLLLRHAPGAAAEAWCAARLGEARLGAFGTLPAGTDRRAIIERAGVAAS